ncbi:hypothetical protein RhiirA5_369980 [Rhizophagus irregularis]|uniref:Uncharacterized protein n=1 Tax=Rhizophagus irregularis TaxID=588596 RepID=A0A2N0QB25_9GLOM|nr:hypothetical protein RhiirA5_369980 [Rhizophagus irregularis]
MSTLSEDIIDLEEFDEPLEYDPFVIDTEEINQDDEKSEVAVFTRDTLIKDIRHTLVPIEYPATSDEGIAYVYHVKIGQILKLHFIMYNKYRMFVSYLQILMYTSYMSAGWMLYTVNNYSVHIQNIVTTGHTEADIVESYEIT